MPGRLTQEEIQHCVASLCDDLNASLDDLHSRYPHMTVADVRDILRQDSEDILTWWIEADDDARGDAELDDNPT
jgi:hypothetical protein